ncbi:NADH dehydrogenase [ubiquinone] 1 beta subcomplex subunit 2, mitochondrial-like [Gigantopelta aegis]|uniref:NADH dehydrogenase [ubiquinone] 1 beta subcomplex subunit 2, mitochondrial-like n=1 Tax=Gigantopelta aegis TaxID=1735272 RepID=UPI001B889104|nr:NADH dehydrogenase [ubiquinone] 1 beta subcomplex subunit 2, mitochondrial-like [Gigantopelta aegis]
MYFLSRIRAASTVLRSRTNQQLTAVRNGGTWVYRRPAIPASKTTLIKAEVMGFVLWYWMLYHLWHEPEHIVGHFVYPEPEQWTDEELGIPPS